MRKRGSAVVVRTTRKLWVYGCAVDDGKRATALQPVLGASSRLLSGAAWTTPSSTVRGDHAVSHQ